MISVGWIAAVVVGGFFSGDDNVDDKTLGIDFEDDFYIDEYKDYKSLANECSDRWWEANGGRNYGGEHDGSGDGDDDAGLYNDIDGAQCASVPGCHMIEHSVPLYVAQRMELGFSAIYGDDRELQRFDAFNAAGHYLVCVPTDFESRSAAIGFNLDLYQYHRLTCGQLDTAACTASETCYDDEGECVANQTTGLGQPPPAAPPPPPPPVVSSSTKKKTSSNCGTVIAAVAGSVAGVALLSMLVATSHHRRRRGKPTANDEPLLMSKTTILA
jgi:hypothetical protein